MTTPNRPDNSVVPLPADSAQSLVDGQSNDWSAAGIEAKRSFVRHEPKETVMESNCRITFNPAKIPGATHSLSSEYVETFWLPVIGPTSFCMLRMLDRMYQPIAGITATPTTSFPLIEFAAAIGVGGNLGRNSVLVRTITRLEVFSILTRTGQNTYSAATHLADLRPAQIAKLPAFLQAIHPQPANA